MKTHAVSLLTLLLCLPRLHAQGFSDTSTTAQRPYTVRYDAVNAMLLQQVQQQQRTIADQQKLLEDLSARVAALERGPR